MSYPPPLGWFYLARLQCSVAPGKNEGVDERTLHISAVLGLDRLRANGEYRNLLHIRSVGDDTGTHTDKTHSRRQPCKSRCGASVAAGNTQSILVAQENRNVDYFDKATNFNPLKF